MEISEIQKVYAAYDIESILANADENVLDPYILEFPARIEPPSAFIASEQTISNISSFN